MKMRDLIAIVECPVSASAVRSTTNLLLELDWYDKSPLTQVLLRNRGRWIHFSNGAPNRGDLQQLNPAQLEPVPDKAQYQSGGYDWHAGMKQYNKALTRATRRNAVYRVPKLGVNPKMIWKDPFGVSFYPVDFLLAGGERVRDGMQYGLDMSFYYICNIDLNNPRGVNLQKITWPEVEAIADRNGWRKEMDAFRAQPIADQQAQLPSYATAGSPGSFLWHFVETLVRSGTLKWNRALHGIAFIRDGGGAIIHSNEPDQLLVFDPSVIKVVEQGENKSGKTLRDTDQTAWKHALLSIIKAVRGEFGGELTWTEQKPTLSFSLGIASFVLTLPEQTYQVGMNLRYQYGRAYGDFSIGDAEIRNQTQGQIVSAIAATAKRIGALKSDLLFVPVLSEKQARAFVTHELGEGQTFDFKTSIYNSAQRKWNSYHLTGTAAFKIGDNDILDQFSVFLTPDALNLSASVKLNDKSVISASPYEKFTPDQREAALDHLATKVIESIQYHFRYVSPENTYRKSWEKWTDPMEFETYKGWLILHCGLGLGGRLRNTFKAEIAAYENLSARDRHNFDVEIRYRTRNF